MSGLMTVGVLAGPPNTPLDFTDFTRVSNFLSQVKVLGHSAHLRSRELLTCVLIN